MDKEQIKYEVFHSKKFEHMDYCLDNQLWEKKHKKPHFLDIYNENIPFNEIPKSYLYIIARNSNYQPIGIAIFEEFSEHILKQMHIIKKTSTYLNPKKEFLLNPQLEILGCVGVYVNPLYRNLKIGSNLMKKIEKHFLQKIKYNKIPVIQARDRAYTLAVKNFKGFVLEDAENCLRQFHQISDISKLISINPIKNLGTDINNESIKELKLSEYVKPKLKKQYLKIKNDIRL